MKKKIHVLLIWPQFLHLISNLNVKFQNRLPLMSIFLMSIYLMTHWNPNGLHSRGPLEFQWQMKKQPIRFPMASTVLTHWISNGIHSTNPLDFQWPTTHWKSNGPLDIQWGIGNPMGHPIGFPMGAKIEIVNLW